MARHTTSPAGKIHSGEAGFRLQGPETFVGIDVAYASAELVASTAPEIGVSTTVTPVLAVEILSLGSGGDVLDKVDLYLEAGTVVWVVEPRTRSLSVYRRGQDVEHHNSSRELTGDPSCRGSASRDRILLVNSL